MSTTSTTLLKSPSFYLSAFGFHTTTRPADSRQPRGDVTPLFLRIPYDIRHMIYQMVLQPEFPLRRWEHYMTCPGCNLDITGAGISKCANILLVNKQVYEEACPILHNIEHLVEGLQKPEDGLWRQVSRADNNRIRRSGGVGKLTETEVRPLRRIKFDVSFQDVKMLSGGNGLGADPWGYLGGGMMGPEPGSEMVTVPPPTTSEFDVLAEEVKDLARVLKEGRSIRKLRIRLRRWPQSYSPGSTVAKCKEETPSKIEQQEVSLQQMLDVFQPLIDFSLEDAEEDVEISAEAIYAQETCSQVHEFVRHFDQSRREYLRGNSKVAGPQSKRCRERL